MNSRTFHLPADWEASHRVLSGQIAPLVKTMTLAGQKLECVIRPAKRSSEHSARLHATPNGGLRSKSTAGKLRAEGAKAGHPDVSWPVARGGFIGLAIEFKHGDGNPSKEQRERIDRLQREGWCVAVCWSWDAAARLLTGYAGMLTVSMAEAP